MAGQTASTMIIMSLDDRSDRINHDSATTITAQVAADIEADIDSGAIAPDTRLPAELELAEQYGVSRVTVRRAIALLRDRGKVVTVHGRGTYAATMATRSRRR
ncbi:MAG: GntR family transcriptional regulator [Streptosporangiaceae bacterium]